MRCFGGLTIDELAEVLDVSPVTVSHDQSAAEAWLSHVMTLGAN